MPRQQRTYLALEKLLAGTPSDRLLVCLGAGVNQVLKHEQSDQETCYGFGNHFGSLMLFKVQSLPL